MKKNESQSENSLSKRSLMVGLAVVLLFFAIVSALYYERKVKTEAEARAKEAIVQAGPRVRTATASLKCVTRPVSFVGDATPFATVMLYAKISGFLQVINVDKGDTVKKGDVLAIIESPELDRQYDAAVADAKNKRADAVRSRMLVASEVVSRQEAERIEATAQMAEANAESIKAQKDYEILRAPFSGTITARYADPGALIQAASSAQTTALPVVRLSEIEKLRIYIYADQASAGSIKVGDPAEIRDVARPDVKATASVTRTSNELDLKTRTLLVEVDLENKDGKFIPGSTVQVTLNVQEPTCIHIPASALVMQRGKSYVGVITKDQTVKLKEVSILDTDGKIVKLISGLSEGERVGLNLAADVSDGDKVQVVDD